MLVEVSLIEQNFAALSGTKTAQRVQKRCFSGTAWAENAYELTRLGNKADMIQNRPRISSFTEAGRDNSAYR